MPARQHPVGVRRRAGAMSWVRTGPRPWPLRARNRPDEAPGAVRFGAWCAWARAKSLSGRPGACAPRSDESGARRSPAAPQPGRRLRQRLARGNRRSPCRQHRRGDGFSGCDRLLHATDAMRVTRVCAMPERDMPCQLDPCFSWRKAGRWPACCRGGSTMAQPRGLRKSGRGGAERRRACRAECRADQAILGHGRGRQDRAIPRSLCSIRARA